MSLCLASPWEWSTFNFKLVQELGTNTHVTASGALFQELRNVFDIKISNLDSA
jgi:hypothetical protein